MSALLDRILVPVAEPEDARTTARAIRRTLRDEPTDPTVIAVHVVEKAGGAPDKASVEQREEIAEEAFQAFREELDGETLETHVVYGTDVTDAIVAAATDHDATAIVFSPRGSNWIVRVLTGDVAYSLVTRADRPVIALPGTDRSADDEASGDLADRDPTTERDEES